MKVSHLKQVIEDMNDDTLLFVAVFEKDEADEYAMSNLNDEKDFEFSLTQWEDIVDKMHKDENMWGEIMNSFRYYVEKKYNDTKGNNDDSK
jgi:hypothetical protein